MVDLTMTRDDPKAQLFAELQRVTAGMLGLHGVDMHMQPMAHHVDRDNGVIVFFTSKDTDIAAAVGEGKRAHFCVVGKDHDYHACLSGTVVQSLDQALVDRFWSPMVAAWYPGGKSDPKLTLLVMSLTDASVWGSTDSALKFGWEMAKSMATSNPPDLGEVNQVRF